MISLHELYAPWVYRRSQILKEAEIFAGGAFYHPVYFPNRYPYVHPEAIAFLDNKMEEYQETFKPIKKEYESITSWIKEISKQNTAKEEGAKLAYIDAVISLGLKGDFPKKDLSLGQFTEDPHFAIIKKRLLLRSML